MLFLTEIGGYLRHLRHELRNNVKTICFGTDFHSTLMWSHYADNHKGFAALYDRTKLVKAKCINEDLSVADDTLVIKDVTYSDARYDLTYEVEEYIRCHMLKPAAVKVEPPRTELTQDKLFRMILQKDEIWAYEKEQRLLPQHISIETKSKLMYLEIMPESIIFGALCPTDLRKELMSICDRINVPVYEMYLNEFEEKYRFEIRKI